MIFDDLFLNYMVEIFVQNESIYVTFKINQLCMSLQKLLVKQF